MTIKLNVIIPDNFTRIIMEGVKLLLLRKRIIERLMIVAGLARLLRREIVDLTSLLLVNKENIPLTMQLALI